MRTAMNVSELAQVLFASAVQRSDDPSSEQVRAIVSARMERDRGECSGCVAQEAGDHPDEYVARMRWAIAAVAAAFPDLKLVSA
jgi:hypothetical protein